ncbi:hypothetical protein EDL96_05100 [Kocuria soli]|uniref:peptidylprolyl isomerase n=1 Tax=Kocuria soli TaxID=2485125 RepID=A0A3N3ZR45_9MICC|nr:FKBP-type peptidyl-prolyl cis-trans isomerase [Kocuria soli]ROZ63733.1 hypothetical protein EDL96_05100 [Kocuria soli]
MRKALLRTGTAIGAAVLLTACTSGGFNSVELSNDPADGEVPEVTFDTPVEVDENQTKVLREGDGEEIEDGSTLLVQAALYRGSDGEELGESYSSGAGQVLKVNSEMKDQLPELYEALTGGMKVGGILAYSSPSTAGNSGQEGDESTSVEVYEIVEKIPSEIDGEMKDSPEGLPEVTENDEGVPEIGDMDEEAPKDLVAENLIDGDGAEVKEGQTVVVDYVGARWEDGKPFESTWDSGTPAALPLDTSIEGWSEGLVGKKVGSRVILSVPADKAYGTEEELGADSGYPTGDLLFVVDILAAEDTPEPEPLPDPTSSTVNEGDGQEVNDGDTLLMTSAPVQDGEAADATPSVVTLDDSMREEDSFLYDQLSKARVGTTVDVTTTSDAGAGQTTESTTRYSVREVIPSEIEGEMQPTPEGLPAVTETEDGTPEIAKPEGDAPKDVTSEYLIEGDGAEVKEGQTVAVNYVGARWEDGEVFDSSYERGQPTAFPLDGVIEGWSEGLVGKKAGSRVIISVSSDKAYGSKEEIEESGNTGAPEGDLVFVVDILGASDTPAAADASPSASATE